MDSSFSLTLQDVDSIVKELPAGIKEGIHARAKPFLNAMAGVLAEPQDLLVLVDKEFGLAKDSVPENLVDLSGYGFSLGKPGLKLRRVLIPDLQAMVREAGRSGITPVTISSTYRSYDTQVDLYQRELRTASKEEVEKLLAPPGHSQHQLGTAIDFGSIDLSFAETAAGKWLFAHAWEYGFALSYPEGKEAETGYDYEPWHYRYVGKSASGLIHDFFGGSEQLFLTFYKDKAEVFQKARR